MLFLIGFMGVGKTTIGKQLALHHKLNFIDIDNKIEKLTNQSISSIFKQEGEGYYRELETQALKSITKKSVVSCGGGIPLYNNNMEFIKKCGISIYLKASEEEIFRRLYKNTKNRPLIQNKSDKQLKIYIKDTLSKREKFYLQADYTIDTNNLSQEQTLRKINSLIIRI